MKPIATPHDPAPRAIDWRILAVCFVFGLLVCSVPIFTPGLFNTDETWAIGNLTIWRSFHHAFTEFSHLTSPEEIRPVFHATLGMLLVLLGENPPAAHFVCYIVHFANAVLAARFLTRLGTPPEQERFYCLFFLATPTAVITLAWTATLSDTLATLFGLASLNLLLLRRNAGLTSEIFGILSLVACLLSKITGLVFAGIIPVLWILELARYRRRDCIAAISIATIWLGLRLVGLSSRAATSVGPYEVAYGWNIVTNIFVGIFYSFALRVSEIGDFWNAAAYYSFWPMVAGGTLLFLSALSIRNWRVLLAGGAFYLGALVLVLPLAQLAPQYFYATGFLLAALVCHAVMNGTWWQKIAALAVIALACAKLYYLDSFYYFSGKTQHRFYSEFSQIIREASCGRPELQDPIYILLPERYYWSIVRSAFPGMRIEQIRIPHVEYIFANQKVSGFASHALVLQVNDDGRIHITQNLQSNCQPNQAPS